jgi:hypothetical protein
MKFGRAMGQAASRRPLSLQKPGFDPSSLHVRLLVDKEHRDRIFSREIRFSIVSIVPPMLLTLSFIYKLLLTEGKKGAAWEPSQKQIFFGTWEHWIEGNLHFCL